MSLLLILPPQIILLTTVTRIAFEPETYVIYKGQGRICPPKEDPRGVTLSDDPRSQNGQQVGIDAFFIHQSYLYLLRYTVEANQGINDKLVEFFLNIFDSLPPQVKWRFIFVIPDSLKKFSSSPGSIISSAHLYTASIQVQ